jgi:hypothetical protein
MAFKTKNPGTAKYGPRWVGDNLSKTATCGSFVLNAAAIGGRWEICHRFFPEHKLWFGKEMTIEDAMREAGNRLISECETALEEVEDATPVLDHYQAELAALMSTFGGVMAAYGVTGISLTYGQESSTWCRPELLEDSFRRDLDEGRAKLKEGKVSS